MKDKSKLDKYLGEFFVQFRVSKKGYEKKKPPKRNTVEAIKSHLKSYILRNNKLDITVESEFPEFKLFWTGYIRTLKKKGLGDTKHNKEIPKGHLVKINELLILLHKVMNGEAFLIDDTKSPPVKTSNPSYVDLLDQLPKKLDEKGKKYIIWQK